MNNLKLWLRSVSNFACLDRDKYFVNWPPFFRASGFHLCLKFYKEKLRKVCF